MGDCYSVVKDGERVLDDSAYYKERPKVEHYTKGGIEPIDFINSNNLNFNLGNAIKYITRCNYKGSKAEDLQKAIDYINFELENN